MNTATRIPPAPCPAHPWCIVDHTDPHEGADYHYSDLIPVGPLALRLDQGTAGATAVEIVTEHADGDILDLDRVDALMARLADLRALLVAATLRGVSA